MINRFTLIILCKIFIKYKEVLFILNISDELRPILNKCGFIKLTPR